MIHAVDIARLISGLAWLILGIRVAVPTIRACTKHARSNDAFKAVLASVVIEHVSYTGMWTKFHSTFLYMSDAELSSRVALHMISTVVAVALIFAVGWLNDSAK